MTELPDTSVWARRRHPTLRTWFESGLRSGGLGTCDQVRLELLHSARNVEEFRQLRADLETLPDAPMGAAEWKRAVEVYEMLAAVKPQWHRSVKHADLLIASAAEAAGVTLVHYDRDYDAIAEVTGQPMRWAAPAGTL